MGRQDRIRTLMTDILELPKDLVLDLPRVTLIGNVQLTLENHRGVILYTDTHIRVAVARGEIVITGQKLTLRSILPDEIIIDGSITNVAYIG
ncbi:MAG: sporulation protein YqfC [Firmicutes bacterium]|nr:sporulation protein YqfC [Bacillota bacterium]